MDIAQLPKDISKLAKRIGDTRPLMEDLAGLFIHRTEKKWDKRGEGENYQGVQWPKLAESTAMKIKSKSTGARRGYEHMLVDEGLMRTALTKSVSEKEAKIFFMSPEGKKYMHHHFGMGNLPKRVVLDITKEDDKALDKRALEFIDKALSKK